jgi:hypothetical protein
MKGTWMRLSYTESNMFKEVAGLRELFAIEYIRLRHNNAANVRGTEATESNQVQRWLNLLLTTASFTLIRQRNYIVREDFILTPEIFFFLLAVPDRFYLLFYIYIYILPQEKRKSLTPVFTIGLSTYFYPCTEIRGKPAAVYGLDR